MNGYVVAKYLRLSSEDTDLKFSAKQESNSISNQRDLLDAHISMMPEFSGATVVEFCDDGWSGKNFERPGVQKLLTQVKRGCINCIVVKDLSRFGRDYLTVGNYLSRIFPFMGVRFIAVNDGYDSIRPLDVDSLETSFKALIYDLYSRELSRKVRSSARLRAERGDYIGVYAPYGYLKDPNRKAHLVIDPPAAEVVRRIFHMMGDGIPALQIAQTLNGEGILTPMRHKAVLYGTYTVHNRCGDVNFWTDSEVRTIIRDERYLGKVVSGKRTCDQIGKHHRKKVSRKDWIVVAETHEPIVSQEEFDRAQANMRPWKEHNGSSPGHIMFRKVRCGICGRAMHRRPSKHTYYFCRTSEMTTAFSCRTDHIEEEEIFSVLLENLRMQAALAVNLSNVWNERQRGQKQDVSDLRKRLTETQETLRQQKGQTRMLYESYVAGEFSKSRYLEQKAALQKQGDTLAAQVASLEAALENCGADGELSNSFVDSFQQYAEVQELTEKVVADTLEAVYIYPDHQIEIVWNHQDALQMLMLELGINEEQEPG